MSDDLKSGDEAPSDGEYEVVGPRGGHTGDFYTMKKGDTLPPTQRPGQHFEKKGK